MIKKRLLSFLGAAAITAALTFTVVSLSPSNGFTSGTMQEVKGNQSLEDVFLELEAEG